MKILNFKLKEKIHSQNSHYFNILFKKITKENKHIKNTFHVLNKNFKLDFKTKDLKKFQKYKNIVLIGMGGSILGSSAIYTFLKKKIKKKVFFFDNIDKKKLIHFKSNCNYKKTLFLVISKSGNTIETLSNFSSLNIIKKNAKNIILISEKKNNILFSLSKKYNLHFINHKTYLGGRYSVLSEVGLVPSLLMGLNVKSLRKKSDKYLKLSKKLLLKKNCLILANFIKNKKYKNIVLLNYLPELEKFLYWYQQLFAESLGKKGKGLLPIISNAPKDHHSLLQLYLDGPKDKLFYIFSEERINLKIVNNKNKLTQSKSPYLKNIDQIKEAQKRAVLNTLKKNGIPFREFRLEKIDEETIGELFAYFILETAMVGKLANLNPFNQPAVEVVKKLTQKFLN